MITSVSKEGIKRRLIFNDSVILVARQERLSFHIKDKKTRLDFNVHFEFSDEGERYKTDVLISPDGKDTNMTLYQWDGTDVHPIILDKKGLDLCYTF